MRRLVAGMALTVLAAIGVLAQVRAPVEYIVRYDPTEASDTNLDADVNGRPMLVDYRDFWYWEVSLLDTGSHWDEETVYRESLWVQFSLWATADVVDDSLGDADWDSIAAFDTNQVHSWKPWRSSSDKVLGLHKIVSDSIWQYHRFQIRARWLASDTLIVGPEWDADSTFADPPSFQHRLRGRDG